MGDFILEVLSIGEKIRRARVYKGYTLKDLCGDKISISKMSCIENDKIDIEEDILDFIAEKLDLDINYLNETVKEQLIRNLNLLEDVENISEYEDLLKYNIDIAKKYEYFDIAFELLHKLFNYYLDFNYKEKCKFLIPQYYNVYQNIDNTENRLICFMDIGRCLFSNEEFNQALNYYKSVIKELENKEKIEEYEILINSIYSVVNCYFAMGDIDKAYEFRKNLIDLVDYTDDKLLKADIYHMLGIFSIKDKDIDKFKYYEKKSYKYYGNNSYRRLEAVLDFALTMFKFDFKDEAKKYTEIIIKEYPRDDIRQIVEFTLKNIKILIENDMIDVAQVICDEILNYSIELNNEKYIEESYYYKALIYSKQNKLDSAEMYINLSLDILLKYGSKLELYNRYMEIANVYHDLGYISESLKYFSLAISLKNKI